MNALIVDTSSWISRLAGKAESEFDEALEEGRVYLTPVVAAELVSGKMNLKQRSDLIDMLSDLPLTVHDLPHWFRVGILRSELGCRGLAVSTPDAHVAQSALDINAKLLTLDRIFVKIAEHTKLKLARMS